jgi:hypothetical protein
VAEIARREADERIARAEQAAAEALAQAEAISGGLRQLAGSLEGQAERILRDVQAGHRRLMGDLRVELPRGSTSDRPRPRGNPLEDLDVPRWASNES